MRLLTAPYILGEAVALLAPDSMGNLAPRLADDPRYMRLDGLLRLGDGPGVVGEIGVRDQDALGRSGGAAGELYVSGVLERQAIPGIYSLLGPLREWSVHLSVTY